MLKRLCKILIMFAVLLMGILLIYYMYVTRLLSSDEMAEVKRLYDAKKPAQSEPTQSDSTRPRPTRSRLNENEKSK